MPAERTAPERWPWAGTDRAGRHRSGCTTTDPATLTATRYRSGWRRLAVYSTDGALVAAVEPDPDHPRRRIWWAAPVPTGAPT